MLEPERLFEFWAARAREAAATARQSQQVSLQEVCLAHCAPRSFLVSRSLSARWLRA